MVSDSAALGPTTLQTPLSIGFSQQEHWNGLPLPLPGDGPDLGTEPVFPVSPELQTNSLLLHHWGRILLINFRKLLDFKSLLFLRLNILIFMNKIPSAFLSEIITT